MVLRITAMPTAARGLKDLDWPDSQAMQEAGSAAAEGAEVLSSRRPRARESANIHHPARHPLRLHLHGRSARTPLVPALTDRVQQEAVEAIEDRLRKSDLERTNLAKEKSGVFSGSWHKSR